MSNAATHSASFTVGSEAEARRVSDLLAETLDVSDAVVAAFERSDGVWDVTLHFGDPPDHEAIRGVVASVTDDALAAGVAFDTVMAKDWVAASLEGLKPVEAGRFIVHGAHDRNRIAPNRLGIEIEAALAFGTGHHGTTRGCLMLLHDILRAKHPRRVLDLGTGTGVLAIAAAKALHRRVLASDIDRRSVEVARDNARLNGVADRVEAICATGFSAPHFAARAPFDLVMANILANPLRALATPMADKLAPSAMVILSGLLPHQAAGVVAAYRGRGLKLLRHLRLDGWSSLLMQRA